MSEKKKGFWSWLGFGKKADEEQAVNNENTSENAEESRAELAQEVLSNEATSQNEAELSLAEKIEEKAEAFEDRVETVFDSVEAKFEQLEDKFEEITDKFEEKVDSIEEQIKEQVAEIATSFETKAEAVEEKLKEVFAEDSAELTQSLAQEEAVDLQKNADFSPPEAGIFEAEAEETPTDNPAETEASSETAAQESYQEKPSEGGFFSRLIKGLIKTKQNIGSGFRNFFRGKKIDDELFEELEEQLLVADLGMPTTSKIINNLTQHATKKQLQDADLLYQQLKVELGEVLKPVSQPLIIDESKKPYVILMVGVNGVGKTTTIGKLARKFQAEGKSVMLAAGDTFRAAAVEQLQVWGERNHIPVVAQSTGSDSASVIFDAMQSAASKGIDVLIADTAGRLQNKNNLMDELKKIVRVMKKYDETAPHEIMLTLDAGIGQNAISQAKIFNEAVGLTGITLTKLDGTAKGGVIFAIADQFNLPIRFIGVGEKIDDLREFNADDFIEALFTHEENAD